LRFEDVINDKEKLLKEAYSFMLGVDNIEGTFLEEKIRSILSSETAGVLYKLREGN